MFLLSLSSTLTSDFLSPTTPPLSQSLFDNGMLVVLFFGTLATLVQYRMVSYGTTSYRMVPYCNMVQDSMVSCGAILNIVSYRIISVSVSVHAREWLAGCVCGCMCACVCVCVCLFVFFFLCVTVGQVTMASKQASIARRFLRLCFGPVPPPACAANFSTPRPTSQLPTPARCCVTHPCL